MVKPRIIYGGFPSRQVEVVMAAEGVLVWKNPAIVSDLLAVIDAGGMSVVRGTNGPGKTTLAVCVSYALASRPQPNGQYWRLADLYGNYRHATISADERVSEEEWLRKTGTRPDPLYIDEIDKVTQTEGATLFLERLVDWCYAERRPCIWIANWNDKGWAESCPRSVRSRMEECATTFVMGADWPDQRKK